MNGAELDPEIVSLIEWVIEEKLRNYNAPRLAVVTTYDETARRVDALPLVGTPQIDRLTREVSWSTPAEVRSIPVADLGTERSKHAIKLQAGDRVLLIPAMHSLSNLVDSTANHTVEPTDARQQDMNDCIALPVCWTSAPTGASAFDRTFSGTMAVGDPLQAGALATKADLDKLARQLYSHLHPGAGAPPTLPILETVVVTPPGQFPGTSDLKAT